MELRWDNLIFAYNLCSYHFVTETWNFLKPLLPEWQRSNKENRHDVVESERPEHPAFFVFVEVKEPKVVQFCENTVNFTRKLFLLQG